MEVYDVVKKLIGEIDPVGDQNIDEQRIHNLNEAIYLTERLIGDIYHVSINEGKQSISMDKAGARAGRYLRSIGAN